MTIEATTYSVRDDEAIVLVMKDDAGAWHVDGLRPGLNAKFDNLEIALGVAQDLLSRMKSARAALKVARRVDDDVAHWLRSFGHSENPNQCSPLEATPA